MIKALGERGGVCGLNYCMDFLTWEAKQMDTEQLLGCMAEHVRHTADIGGVEVCALGGDMDGIDPNPAIPDVSFVQRLVPALKKKGFHESEIEKIFSGNVLRVYQEILK